MSTFIFELDAPEETNAILPNLLARVREAIGEFGTVECAYELDPTSTVLSMGDLTQ